MVSTNSGLTRGMFRIPFTGRNPSFVVAALLVGIGILGFSYYSLYNQYCALELQLKVMNDNEQANRKVVSMKLKNLQVIQTNNEKLTHDLKSKEEEVNLIKKQMEIMGEEMAKLKLNDQVEMKKLRDTNKKLQSALDQAKNLINKSNHEKDDLKNNDKSQFKHKTESNNNLKVKKTDDDQEYNGLSLPPLPLPIVKKLNPNFPQAFNNAENSLRRPDRMF